MPKHINSKPYWLRINSLWYRKLSILSQYGLELICLGIDALYQL